MNPFLRVSKIGLISFFSGFAAGFLVALIFPRIGEANYMFHLGQAGWLKAVYPQPEVYASTISLMIFLRNYSVGLLFAISPLILIYYTAYYRKRYPFRCEDPLSKLSREIYLILTVYPISVLFAYGFAVFGLFLGFILLENSFGELLRWITYLVPHGLIEILGIILAASTSIVIRDICLRNPTESFSNLKEIPKRGFINF